MQNKVTTQRKKQQLNEQWYVARNEKNEFFICKDEMQVLCVCKIYLLHGHLYFEKFTHSMTMKTAAKFFQEACQFLDAAENFIENNTCYPGYY